MRRVGIVMVIVGAVGLVAPWSPIAHAEGTDGSRSPEALEAAFVADTNVIRAEHGVAELPIEPNLMAKARDWSATMAAAGKIWHSDLRDGITIEWTRLGENVGKGGGVEALQAAFVDSPSHYQNLIDPDWEALGIGVTVDEHDTIYVAVEFVEYPDTSAPPVASTADPDTSASQPAQPETAPTLPPAPRPDEAGGSTPPADPAPSAHLDLMLRHLRLLDG